MFRDAPRFVPHEYVDDLFREEIRNWRSGDKKSRQRAVGVARSKMQRAHC